MASSSSSRQQNTDHNSFSGISPPSEKRRSSGSSKLYDVFINHRGPDVKETLAGDLYKSLHGLQLSVFLDSEELDLGDVFPFHIETAIRSSSVHIAIFSKGYADSAWCLAELSLILETDAKIIPVFYDVAPSDLRFIEKGVYAQAFAEYEEKGRYLENLERWKKSLQSVSVITGYECSKHNDVHEDLCKRIVITVLKEVQNKKPLHVAEHSVGLNKMVRDLEIFCKLNEREGENFNIIGIYGMGGVGKTTLAKELFNKKRSEYDGSCFLFDVREAYVKGVLPSLQSKLIQDLVQESTVKFQSIDAGISHLKHRLPNAGLLRFLIVLDDIDNMKQLDALLIRDKQNLVIITTRDEGVLISAGINLRFNLRGMNKHDGRELFCQHAFNQPNPVSGYEDLVDAFVKVCGGLPLSLKVFGRHVYGRLQDYWLLELDKIRRVLPGDVLHSLKISFDSLDHEEKQIFMDIACFFNNKYKSAATEIWKISGWAAEHALQRLRERCLVEKTILGLDGVLRMHDHLCDLGRQMAEEFTPRRVWCPKYLQSLDSKGFQKTLAETNARCFHSMRDRFMDAQITFFIGNSDYCSQASTSLLWLELMLNGNEHNCIPSWIPLQNLQCLKIFHLRPEGLWTNNVQAPSLCDQEKIRVDSLKNPNFIEIGMCKKLTKLVICQRLELKKLCLEGLYCLEMIRVDRCKNLNCVALSSCKNLTDLAISGCLELKKLCFEDVYSLETITVDSCEKLKCFELNGRDKLKYLVLEKLPCLQRLQLTTSGGCGKLKYLILGNCGNLRTVSGSFDVSELLIEDCAKLEELPNLSQVERIEIKRCQKLKNIAGIEELQGLKIVHLSQVGSNFIQGLQALSKLPSECMTAIGRAVDGGESSLNSDIFSSLVGNHTVCKLDMVEDGFGYSVAEESDCLSAIIVCALVVAEKSRSWIDLTPNKYYYSRQYLLGKGKWIVTMVITDQQSINCQNNSILLLTHQLDGIETKFARMVQLEKGQEWEALQLYKKIVDHLYKQPVS